MHAYAEKTKKKSKDRTVANPAVKKESNVKQSFGFVDNRIETASHLKLKNIKNDKPKVKQDTYFQAIDEKYSAQQQYLIQKKEKKQGVPQNRVAQLVKSYLGGQMDEYFDSTNDKSAYDYIDTLIDYKDYDLSAEDVDHAFLNDVATRFARGKYKDYANIIGQTLEKLKQHTLALKLGNSLIPLPPENESDSERHERLKKEAVDLEKQKILEEEDKQRMKWVTQAHAELFSIFKSKENQKQLSEILENKENDFLIYRGEWYERSLKIIGAGTFGGAPKASGSDLLTVKNQKFKKAKDIQKERGGDDVKEILNEWTTDASLAKTYGERFVMLIGLIDNPNERQQHVVYPEAGVQGEQGVLADSRFPLKKLAIWSITEEPNFEKRAKGGS